MYAYKYGVSKKHSFNSPPKKTVKLLLDKPIAVYQSFCMNVKPARKPMLTRTLIPIHNANNEYKRTDWDCEIYTLIFFSFFLNA